MQISFWGLLSVTYAHGVLETAHGNLTLKSVMLWLEIAEANVQRMIKSLALAGRKTSWKTGNDVFGWDCHYDKKKKNFP